MKTTTTYAAMIGCAGAILFSASPSRATGPNMFTYTFGVIMFQNAYFSGTTFLGSGCGGDDLSRSTFNDQASSIIIRQGYTATFYSDANLSGNSQIWSAPTDADLDIGYVGDVWNDVISSVYQCTY